MHHGLFEGETGRSIIGAFYEVYNTLGYGFLESVYCAAFEQELTERGYRVSREVSIPVVYKGVELARQRIDMLVNDRIVVEVKSTADLQPAARRQLHNYLRATHLEIGFLFHFGPKPAFHRLVCLNSSPQRNRRQSISLNLPLQRSSNSG